ncbi:LysR family transcriptional regulator [Bdellovibrio bacteriovorus]|uniref:LysR family transcriptional regulator n=1 Tax=Bdellovibrio bacteriovorus TaxID=959 RepID=UPI0021CEAF01|nr:LysR family transcriptional regulator [Bdellovibrio bacteriovorus]UXR65125.1 LysR family transcriptional regulator [Bdellovibrio bacteriovorus]
MSEPNIYHLKYFIKAAELGSLAAAAKSLNISQPAISQAIRKLEENLQCELLLHTKNRFKLTEEGRLLLERSRGILSQLEDLKSDLKGRSEIVSGPLTLATSSAVAHYLLPAPLKNLLKTHPSVTPEVHFGSVQEIMQMVRSGKCELGLVIDDSRPTGFEGKLLGEGGFRCIQKSTAVPVQPRFLSTLESPGKTELEKAYKRASGKAALTALTVESWEVIAQMSLLGLGVGFVPDFIAASQPGVKTIEEFSEWAERIRYKIYLIHLGEHQLSKPARLFVKALT